MALKEIHIERGKTYSIDVYWGADPVIRKAITAVSLATGAPRLTVPNHGMPDGWQGEIYGVSGMKQINDVGVQECLVIDANTIELNKVNPVDDNGKIWPAYTEGGFVSFKTPRDLSNYVPVIDFKDKIGGTAWASSQLDRAPLNIITAASDNATKKTTLRISAVDTAAIPMSIKKGVAELEMHNTTDPSDVVRLRLFKSSSEESDPVRVTGEVTT